MRQDSGEKRELVQAFEIAQDARYETYDTYAASIVRQLCTWNLAYEDERNQVWVKCEVNLPRPRHSKGHTRPFYCEQAFSRTMLKDAPDTCAMLRWIRKKLAQSMTDELERRDILTIPPRR